MSMEIGGKLYYSWDKESNVDLGILPDDWDVRVSEDNRVYFLDHHSQATCWEHPTTKKRYKVDNDLPYGWQRFQDENKKLVFVDHVEQQVCLVDPRLLSSKRLTKRSLIQKYAGIQHRFQSHTKASEIIRNVNLRGKVAMVTGANSGLGFETARVLAMAGAHVFLACRNTSKANSAVQRILADNPSANVEVLQINLASLDSIRACAQQFTARNLSLHILVCNAAVFGVPFQLSVDGLELHFATNHLGHFYLVQLLRETLIKSAPARVVVVSSESHRYTDLNAASMNLCTLQKPNKEGYHAITAYGTSKLCNMLFGLELNRILIPVGVTCNVVHPGNLLSTNMLRNAGVFYNLLRMIMWPFVKSVEQAAAGIVFCAAHPTMDEIGGLYLYDCWPVHPSLEAQDGDTATALWELSEQLIRERTTPI